MDAKKSPDWAHELVQRHANAARALEHMYTEKNIERLKAVSAELESAVSDPPKTPDMLTEVQRGAIEWAAGRAHVEALGKPITGVEGKRWRVLSDMFRFSSPAADSRVTRAVVCSCPSDECDIETLGSTGSSRCARVASADSQHERAADSPTVPIELSGVAEAIESGDGFWRTCSGCHETCDGHPVGDYPYSEILKCDLGAGCSECGGIGAVWDDTDYGAMAAAGDADEIAREEARAASSSTNAHASAAQTEGITTAARDVLAERERQVTAEGWTAEHDDQHDAGEMAAAASAYCLAAADALHPFSHGDGNYRDHAPVQWPWAPEWWKSSTPRRDLVKAGALLLAEIERIDRGTAGAAPEDQLK